MASYYVLWKANRNLPPAPDPKIRIKQYEQMLALMKSQIQSGVFKEVHSFLQTGAGYCITGDLPDEQIYEALDMWTPLISFELHRTIPIIKAIEIEISNLKKMAEQS